MKTCKGMSRLTGKRCKRTATRGPWCISHDPKKKTWRHRNAKRAAAARNGQAKKARAKTVNFTLGPIFKEMIDMEIRQAIADALKQ